MSSTPAWEQSKENAAPLRRGRNVAALERASSQQQRGDKEQMIRHYEGLVRPSEAPDVTEMGDDPLVHWLSYIKYYQDSFPSDTHNQFLLMERCTRALVKMKQYADDERLIGVCAKYADKTKDAGQVFKYLHQQKVGSYTALFWIAWAFVAEKDGDFPFAEQVFKKGISKNAQPTQMLKIRHQQFQRRMSRHWLNSSERNDNLEEEEEEDSGRSRAALGGLSRDRVRKNDRGGTARQGSRARAASGRGAIAEQHNSNNTNSNTNGAFAIFVEETGENAANGYNLDQSFAGNEKRVLERDADRRKENTLDAERWNERGGLHGRSKSHPRAPSAGPPPAFAVFVDEECAAQHEKEAEERTAHAEQQRQVRDERTFRERKDEGMAERLTRDPLRYVRDPTQLDSDQQADEEANQGKNEAPGPDAKKERKSRAGFDKRLLKDANGVEQSVEEARAVCRCFKAAPVSVNFNLLHVAEVDQSVDMMGDSQMDLDDDDSIEDVSMAESVRASSRKTTDGKQPRKMTKLASTKKGRVLFKQEVSFEASLNQTAISAASSAVNEAEAVGLPMGKEEETINTKFAMKELSMMFSSPAFGNEDSVLQAERSQRARANQSQADDEGSEASYDNIADLVGHINLNNSILGDEEGGEENKGPRNPLARMTTIPGFEQMALREIASDDGSDESLGCHSRARRPLQSAAQLDPLHGEENELSDDPGFQIYQDEEAGKPAAREPEAKSTFEIFQDGDAAGDSRNSMKPAVKPGAVKSMFEIFQDDDAEGDELGEKQAAKPPVSKPMFDIFQDEFTGHDAGSSSDGRGETSTLHLFNEVMLPIDQGRATALDVQEDDECKPPAAQQRSAGLGFSVYQDAPEPTSGVPTSRGEGETATLTSTLSLFDDIADDLNRSSMEARRPDSQKPGQGGAFQIYSDEPGDNDILCGRAEESNDAPNFGDLSRIDPFNEPTSIVSYKRKLSIDSTYSPDGEQDEGVEYVATHDHDIKMALRRLRASSSVASNSRAPLWSLLSQEGEVYDLPHLVLPRAFRGKTVQGKTEINIGKHSGVVRSELGRGAYGVVVLMDVETHPEQSTIAVKAQSPTDCLAWEFEILRSVEQRIGSKESGSGPFPRALTFLALADGGVLSMTAGSKSGLNLVDLVNLYKVKLGEPVPELIALYYTSRMLKHLETLHWYGKILHCDIKPDNFVLSHTEASENPCCGLEGSELMLVDFGRAVDLTKLSDNRHDVFNAKLHGCATGQNMRCVAMRTGRSWSFDVDTYGILCSAHVLLFGTHMQIEKSGDNQWQPVCKFRRYWQKDLWAETFESLLNLDEVSGSAIGSRPRSLRSLRGKMESYLEGKSSDLRSAIIRQATLLPANREQLG